MAKYWVEIARFSPRHDGFIGARGYIGTEKAYETPDSNFLNRAEKYARGLTNNGKYPKAEVAVLEFSSQDDFHDHVSEPIKPRAWENMVSVHRVVGSFAGGASRLWRHPTPDAPENDPRWEENPGVREIGRHIYDYASARQFLLGRGNVRKLANNTSVERISDHAVNRMMLSLKESASDVIAVVLHNTYIVAYTSDGRILLNSGGYHTTTTKQRLNQLLPPGYGVTQRDYAWYVRTPNGEYPFADGAILYPGASMEYETP